MKTMNEKEIDIWLKEAEYYAEKYNEVDKCTNHEVGIIYKYKGKLYLVEFCNGHVCEEWGEHRYIRDSYKPIEVIEKKRMVEVSEYEIVKKEKKE